MRKLVVLLASAGLLLGLTSSAQAGQFVTNTSTVALALGGLPGAPTSALPGTEALVALNNGSQGNPTLGHNILASATVWSTVNFGPGTSLFTGVPLISNLKITVRNQNGFLQDGFLDGVDRTARRFWTKLQELCAAHPSVYSSVRGAGLMLGLVCNEEAGVVNVDVVAKLRERGLLTVGAAQNVIRLLPPLIVEDGHIDEALSILEAVAREIEEARDAA